MGVDCGEEGSGGSERRVGGGLQQPAGQFSTGNWWPQRGGGEAGVE